MKKNYDVIKTLDLAGKKYKYFSLAEAGKRFDKDLSRLPFCLKILLENLLRFEDGKIVKSSDIEALINSVHDAENRIEIAFSPARVLMQDFTGVPAVVDLATMRDEMKKSGRDPKKINPLVPVDLIIDHSVQVDFTGADAFSKNVEQEYKRNLERYEFLKWGQESFDNFRVVPPGTGICHQVNLENLAKIVWNIKINGELFAYPDTVVGTDSHTTMINGLAILGWGVGGIEAEAAMLGQPISMLIPEVLGFRLNGALKDGVTATDLVLTITNILRKKGVVGKFVEFCGSGIANLSLADRATIANMAPEYGATCGIFPIDQETLNYLYLTGRSQEQIALVEAYAKEQMMFYDKNSDELEFSEIIELDLSKIEASVAGPSRPQEHNNLSNVGKSFQNFATKINADLNKERVAIPDLNTDLGNGDIVVAAITSCTNTSNPAVLIAAGLVARNAYNQGLKVKNFVKTSLAPGSQVVSEYLIACGLQHYLDQLGFNLVGYGCTTCIGNSGPLHPQIEEVIRHKNLLLVSILSGNRNYEGRIHSATKASYLASPPLVVAYALAGNINIDLASEALGIGKDGKKVYLKDIWPSNDEIKKLINNFVNRQIFEKKYADLFVGNKMWQEIKTTKSDTYNWNKESTYIRLPHYFESKNKLSDISGARILALFGDSITTDHISPAGDIADHSPAAEYLKSKGITKKDFNSYGSRRGNHEVMMRGTFANIRIKNEIVAGKEGGYTKFFPEERIVSIYHAAILYSQRNLPLVIFAGKEYGAGSSRDWAAKGTYLLGIKAVIAESFERIHRSNLIGMGVLPLTFIDDENRKTLKISGDETVEILGINNNIIAKQNLKCILTRKDGSKSEFIVLCRLDTSNEVDYYKTGGILQFVLNK